MKLSTETIQSIAERMKSVPDKTAVAMKTLGSATESVVSVTQTAASAADSAACMPEAIASTHDPATSGHCRIAFAVRSSTFLTFP